MNRRPGLASGLLLIALLLFPGFSPLFAAQAAPPAQQTAPPPPPTPQQLDQLLAPVALYPDQLLAQITTASTNPQEILDVTNWLAQNPSLTGAALTDAAQKQGFDPAFLALVAFPTVLQMMADHIDDYAAIGQAMTANQAEVAASIQRLRSQAYASGALRSNQQQKVEVQQVSNQPVYVIQPAQPQVVYVPQYNPTVVYVAPSTSTVVTTSLITFGVGIGIGLPDRQQPALGMGRLGMGLGSRRLLQSRPMGRSLGRRLSSAQHLVSSPTTLLRRLSRIRRQLALSPAKLPSTLPRAPAGLPPTLALSGQPRLPPPGPWPTRLSPAIDPTSQARPTRLPPTKQQPSTERH